MAQSYIIAGCRTPIGRMLGGLSSVPAPQLGANTVAESLRRAQLPVETVDEVIMGNVLSAGLGQAPARQAALLAGLPPTVSALTINKMCGSGLKAVMLADQTIRLGEANCVIAGGLESMSRAPHLLMGSRAGYRFGHQQVLDSMLHDGLWCAFEDTAMGCEADYIAQSRDVSRDDQDAFSAESHRRAVDATNRGAFEKETVPVVISSRKGDVTITQDEGPRAETTAETLGKLRPAFDREGTVTAGNASQISDGAASVVVVSESLASEFRSPLKARIVASATSGVEPKEIFIAPVTAIQKVLQLAKLSIDDIDLFELNEAFAAQALACMRPLEMPHEKTNVNGGAVALGHPIGASGARVLVTLLHALAERNLQRGLVSLCLGGGNAVAMIVERV